MAVGRRGKRTVALQTQLQFGPKETALAALIKQAGASKRSDIRSTRAAAKGSVKAAKASRAETNRNYARANQDLAQTASDVAKVSGSTSDVAGELARASARNTLDQQLDRNENTARIREAREGRRGDVRAIRQTYRSNISDIADQLVALQGEKGTYAASALQAISDTQRKDRQQRRRDRRQQAADQLQTETTEAGQTARNEADITSAEKIAADKIAADKANAAKPGGGKPATRSEFKTFQTDVQKAVRQAQGMFKAGRSKNQAFNLLLKGRAADKTGVRKITAVSDTLAIRAALQTIWDGKVSASTARQIRRQRGIKPGQITGLSMSGKPPSKLTWGALETLAR